jgi:hypothetical protein
MDLPQLFQKIAPFLSGDKCSFEVELLNTVADENTYQITCSIFGENKWDALLLKLYITLDIPVLINTLKINYGINADEDSILIFIKKKHIDIIPHLSLYTNLGTNYDEISKVYYGSRGQIIMERFGI